MRRTTFLFAVIAALLVAATMAAQTAAERKLNIGGEPPVILERKATSTSQPQFTAVELLPGRGMNVFQIRAFIPGLGERELIASPSLTVAAQELNGGPDDYSGVKSFKFGGAILVPWANRIRGQLTPDGKWIKTSIAGHETTLPANWSGKKPGAEKHAIHGLILDSKFQPLPTLGAKSTTATEVWRAIWNDDFDGHWPSKLQAVVHTRLEQNAVEITVSAKNVGNEPTPVGIGWHPYFAFPSGRREQVQLRIPAKQRTIVNNYDDVFPTGQVKDVAGSEYDFRNGRALAQMYLDDCFLDLQRGADGNVIAEIIDPAAKYGLRIVGLSKEIQSFQVYAPPDKQFVALEPQFNLADPFNTKVWGDRDTGMVMLKPGESTTYHVKLELFVPVAK